MEFLFEEWQDVWLPDVKERRLDISLPKEIRKIITFTGIRRAGKTYFMYCIMKKLLENVPKTSIFYVNFEDERVEKTKENLTKVVPTLIKLYGNGKKSYYLFLDEPQVMPEWSRWLRRLNDSYRNITLFVSGSSSKLSSSEIPTELRGRALNYEVLPLSFREYLEFRNIGIEESFEHNERKLAEVRGALGEYIENGGFPEVVLSESIIEKRRIVQDYFKTIVSRDIAERHRIKNITLLQQFLRLLLNTTDFSVNKSVAILRSQGFSAGKETMLKFTQYTEEAYFCMFVPIFSYKVKDQMRYPRKVFFTDNAFLTCISLRFSKDLGRLYENLVAIELRRLKTKVPSIDFYYWKDSSGRECDFVVKDDLKVRQLIQVCYDISDFDTRKRELDALLKAGSELKCSDLLVITSEYEGDERIEGKIVKFIPLWKWLLSDARVK